MELKGAIVLITGASSGIGAMMAQHLAQRGAIPILTARSPDKLEKVSSLIHSEHQCYVMDVTNNEQVQQVIQHVQDKYGYIDILINNAGYGVFQTFVEAPLDEFAAMMDVNYLGVVRCTQAVLPSMLAAKRGHIINIASLAGKIGSAKSSAYTATKHAVIGMTNSLRLELMGTGIHLTTINPGPIRTPFFERADPSGNYVKQIDFLMLKPEKVVRAIIHAIEHQSAEKNLPRAALFGVLLFQLFPRVFERLAHTFLNKK